MKKTPRKRRGTEERNPRSRELDRLSTRQLLRVINLEDATVAESVRKELPAITRAVETIVDALSRGGRLIYVGAGTSGRLATLDAAECAPTFGVPAKLVQAVIAGGRRVLTVSHSMRYPIDAPSANALISVCSSSNSSEVDGLPKGTFIGK